MGCKQLKSKKHMSHAMQKLLTWETDSLKHIHYFHFTSTENKTPNFHFEATLKKSLTVGS